MHAAANATAVILLRAAHYDPDSLFAVLARLAYEHPGWERVLPAHGLNLAWSVTDAEALPAGGYITDRSEFAFVVDRLTARAAVHEPVRNGRDGPI